MNQPRHSYGDLMQMQSLPLKIKITMTERRIYDWYNYWRGDVCLSYSGGKDSTVLKHIIDNMGLNIPSVFDNTGLEYPEIQKFAMSQPNVTTVRPEMMFTDVLKEYGYPVVSKEISEKIKIYKRGVPWVRKYFEDPTAGRNDGKKSKYYIAEKWHKLIDAPFDVSGDCCRVMKKRPLQKYQKETGRQPIVATMASESKLRERAWVQAGCNAFESRHPRSMPMAFWTEQDVLHYIKEKNVPICSLYGDIIVKPKSEEDKDQITFADYMNQYDGEVLTTTGMKRTGCMFCMFGCHLEKSPNRFQRMKETHPRQYEYCIGGGEMVDGKWKPNKKGLGLGFVLDFIECQY